MSSQNYIVIYFGIRIIVTSVIVFFAETVFLRNMCSSFFISCMFELYGFVDSFGGSRFRLNVSAELTLAVLLPTPGRVLRRNGE